MITNEEQVIKLITKGGQGIKFPVSESIIIKSNQISDDINYHDSIFKFYNQIQNYYKAHHNLSIVISYKIKKIMYKHC
jgi:hypothetical protein